MRSVKRQKSWKYQTYITKVSYFLKKPKGFDWSGKLYFDVRFGFSSVNSDIDNPLKPLLDIMQKRFNFNDRQIYRLNVEKQIVKKGKEFVEVAVHNVEHPPICCPVCQEIACEC